MRKKKKGATLIIVIIIFMFISSVTIGMLSMIAGNYTARVSESERIENLYSSESGIDTAYNIAGKTVGAGIKYGYLQVARLRCQVNEGENQDTYNDLIDDIIKLRDQIKSDEALLEDPDIENSKAKELFVDIEKCKNGIKTTKKTIDVLYKVEFRRAFMEYIKNEKNNKSILIDSINLKQYIDISLSYDDEEEAKKDDDQLDEDIPPAHKVNMKSTVYDVEFPRTQEGIDKDGKSKTWPVISVPTDPNSVPTGLQYHGENTKVKNILNKSDDKDYKETHKVDVDFNQTTGEEYYDLMIDSKFLSTEPNSKVVGKNEREIQASYRILIPSYDSVLFAKSSANPDDYKVLNRGLTIGGNMDVNKVGKLEVKGDIFVEGIERDKDGYKNLVDDYGKAYAKFVDGIRIDKSNVDFLPAEVADDGEKTKTVNVNTRGTFNIKNDSTVIIGDDDENEDSKGNLYAANVFAGDIDDVNHLASGSNLTVNNNVVTDNDLTVSATGTELNICNFYGINNRRTEYNSNIDSNSDYIKYPKFSDEDDEDEVEGLINSVGRTSSSIIVNGKKDNKAKVTIWDNAYIMGTAHIATAGDYQTGESIAVKGNYIAYAVPVSPDEKFKYDKPLQVLDEDNIFKKANHFKNFWDGKDIKGMDISPATVEDSGIIFKDPTKIHSIGALVYKDSYILNPTVIQSSTNYTIDMEAKGGDVYKQRIEYAKQIYDLGISTDPTEEDYMGEYNDCKGYTVDKILGKLSGISADGWDKELDTGNNIAIFNPTTNPITIYRDLNAVIVTNGDVIIQGNVDFKGTIIAKANLTVENGSKATIEYNENVIKKIQNNPKYVDSFKEVLGWVKEIKKDEDAEAANKTLLKQVLDAQYDIKSYVKDRYWKLIR